VQHISKSDAELLHHLITARRENKMLYSR